MQEKCIKFPEIPGIFWNFGGSLKLQGITTKSTSISEEKLMVNEQTKYKSVPFF